MENILTRDDESFYKGINKNTYDLLFNDLKNKSNEKSGSYESLEALCIISKFTKLDNAKIWSLMSGVYDSNEDYVFATITWNNELNSYVFQNGEFKIAFNLLSDYMTHEEIKTELTSDKRNHQCHFKSLMLVRMYPEFRLTTGYVYLEKKRILHTVVEYDDNEETIILDWTKNLRMTKEEYQKLTNFRTIETIQGYDVLSDLAGPVTKSNIDLKTYCAFRSEIVKELKKNSRIF